MNSKKHGPIAVFCIIRTVSCTTFCLLSGNVYAQLVDELPHQCVLTTYSRSATKSFIANALSTFDTELAVDTIENVNWMKHRVPNDKL